MLIGVVQLYYPISKSLNLRKPSINALKCYQPDLYKCFINYNVIEDNFIFCLWLLILPISLICTLINLTNVGRDTNIK